MQDAKAGCLALFGIAMIIIGYGIACTNNGNECPDLDSIFEDLRQAAGAVTCPSGFQDRIDEYWDCIDEAVNDDAEIYPGWPEVQVKLKTLAEACGCGGTMLSAPSLALMTVAATCIAQGQWAWP